MENNTLEIKASIQIQKPTQEVFDAIVDPAKMSNYFISKSTGKLESGAELIWEFPEFDFKVPVQVDKVKKDEYVSFYWDTNNLLVEIALTAHHDGSTIVRVTEKSMPNDEAGIKWLRGNTEGWANFLACMKAYLEYGINLRKGAYDFQGEAAKK